MSTTTTETKIYIPTPLRTYTDNQTTVTASGPTVGAALGQLVERYPTLRPHLYSESGKLRSFVNVYRNDEDIRFLDREDTVLGPGDELSIVPSIAGGR